MLWLGFAPAICLKSSLRIHLDIPLKEFYRSPDNNYDSEMCLKGETVKKTLGFICLIGIMALGCTRMQSVRAYENVPDQRPYVSMGTLEVNVPADSIPPSKLLWGGIELLSLTYATTPSRGDIYKSALKSKLAKIANARHDADAVINVEFWPDPASEDFPNGKVYARGEMVRYQRFPNSTVNEAPAT